MSSACAGKHRTCWCRDKNRQGFPGTLPAPSRPPERRDRYIKNRLAEGRLELRGIGGSLQFGDDFCRVGVGHFVRRQQRDARLIVRRIGTAVPGASTGRAGINTVIAVVIVEMLAERRHIPPITQRRYRARADGLHLLAAKLHRQIVWRTESMIRTMTSCAGLLTGS